MEGIIIAIFLVLVALLLDPTVSANLETILSWLIGPESDDLAHANADLWFDDARGFLSYLDECEVSRAPVDVDFIAFPTRLDQPSNEQAAESPSVESAPVEPVSDPVREPAEPDHFERLDGFHRMPRLHCNRRNQGAHPRDQARQDRAGRLLHRNTRIDGAHPRDDRGQDRSGVFLEDRQTARHNNGERRRQKRALLELITAGLTLALCICALSRLG